MHSAAFGAATVVIGAVLLTSPLGFTLERNYGLHWLFKLRGPLESPPGVAVVGIDGRSGREMGLSRLPRDWPRTVHAAVVRQVLEAGAVGVVLDFDFSSTRNDQHDLALARSIRDAGSVILFERLEGRRERLVTSSGAGAWVWREDAYPPVPVLEAAARAVAPFPLPKIEKSSYQFWVFKPSLGDSPTTAAMAVQMALLSHQSAWTRALAAAGVRDLPGSDRLTAPGALRDYMRVLRKRFLAEQTLGDLVLASVDGLDFQDYDRQAIETLVGLYAGPDERFTNYYGPPGTVVTVPFHEVVRADRRIATAQSAGLQATHPFEAALSRRTVFVGYSDLSEPDQPDRFYTVFTSRNGIDLSGVEIMATAFANLVENASVRPLDAPTSLLIIVLFGLLVSQLVFWPPAYVGVPMVVLVSAVYAYAAGELFAERALWSPMVAPLSVQAPFAIVAGLLGQYLLERREKLRVGAAMAQYLPKNLARELAAGKVDSSSLNKVVHGVCLATDMSGFSTISEQRSPAALAKFMNAYFDAIAEVLKSGDVTEFHADTIVCAWLGEPGEEAMRRSAVNGALAVVDVIERFRAADPDLRLTARVGLQQGAFYLGHTGGGGRMSFSILGDPANSASRLEGMNKRFGTRVLAAESVVTGLDEFALRPLGEFRVVGKSEIIPVVEVLGRTGQIDERQESLRNRHIAALAAFWMQDWAGAVSLFQEISENFPEDRVSQFYLALSESYAAGNAPTDNPTLISLTEK